MKTTAVVGSDEYFEIEHEVVLVRLAFLVAVLLPIGLRACVG